MAGPGMLFPLLICIRLGHLNAGTIVNRSNHLYGNPIRRLNSTIAEVLNKILHCQSLELRRHESICEDVHHDMKKTSICFIRGGNGVSPAVDVLDEVFESLRIVCGFGQGDLVLGDLFAGELKEAGKVFGRFGESVNVEVVDCWYLGLVVCSGEDYFDCLGLEDAGR